MNLSYFSLILIPQTYFSNIYCIINLPKSYRSSPVIVFQDVFTSIAVEIPTTWLLFHPICYISIPS